MTLRSAQDWCFEAAERVYKCAQKQHLRMIAAPTKEIVDHVVARFDPDPDCGYWVGKKGEEVRERSERALRKTRL
tara:strand:- start:445 stop:669 length:225 start_codon:yes stop_codon:yes gene_type:complete